MKDKVQTIVSSMDYIAGVHVSQQMCSHRTCAPSMIMMQLHLPCSFQPLPHQQQFQQRLSTSKGHRESGHLGNSGEDAAYDGSPSKLGGSGYALACVVRLRQGLRFDEDLDFFESLSLDEDELFFDDE